MRKVIFALFLLAPLRLAAAPIHYQIDPDRSVLRLQLGTSGIFGFAGHDHEIEARVVRGEVTRDEGDAKLNAVDLEIAASSLKVLDPKTSAKDRAEVQSKMESDEVLDVTGHPTITFRSTRVEFKPGPNDLEVIGNLTLRDKTRPVKVRCHLQIEGDTLKTTGEAEFKQKDFGIQPVGAGLGTVKVKNEIHLTFEIHARPEG